MTANNYFRAARRNFNPNRHKVSSAALSRIRTILKMGSRQKFARCNQRNMKLAQKLDLALGFSQEEVNARKGFHTKKAHICGECRCKRVAGEATHGHFYWPDRDGNTSWKDGRDAYSKWDELPEEVGHYGVGPCWYHGQGRRRFGARGAAGVYEKMVRREIDIMRAFGAAPDDGGAFIVGLKQDVELAEVRTELKDALSHARETLEEWKEKVQSNEAMTEKGGKDGSIRMTDKSRIELGLKIDLALAKIAKDDFFTAQDEYVHQDEMKMFLQRVLSAAEQFIHDTDDWKEFIALTKQAAFGVRTGRTKK